MGLRVGPTTNHYIEPADPSARRTLVRVREGAYLTSIEAARRARTPDLYSEDKRAQVRDRESTMLVGSKLLLLDSRRCVERDDPQVHRARVSQM